MGDREDIRLEILARMIIDGMFREDEEGDRKASGPVDPSPRKTQRVLLAFGLPRLSPSPSSSSSSPSQGGGEGEAFREIVAVCREMFRAAA